MGAIGTGKTEGMLTSIEADRLNNARGILRLSRANTIVVFPNGWTGAKTVLKELTGLQRPEDLSNAARGFSIAMTGARAQQKRNFAEDLSREMAEAERRGVIDRAVEQAVENARAAAERNGGKLAASTEGVLREVARTTAQRELIDRMLRRDRGGRRYDGIHTRNITKADFDKVG